MGDGGGDTARKAPRAPPPGILVEQKRPGSGFCEEGVAAELQLRPTSGQGGPGLTQCTSVAMGPGGTRPQPVVAWAWLSH